MKDNTEMNITNGTGGDNLDGKPDDPLASYTPQQRRTILKGLRILARVAIRSYLREHGLESRSGAGPVKENGE